MANTAPKKLTASMLVRVEPDFMDRVKEQSWKQKETISDFVRTAVEQRIERELHINLRVAT